MRMTTQDTSREAHDHVKKTGRKENYKQKIYEFLYVNGGRTCDELERELNMSHQTCSASITGLKKEQAIMDSGEKRKTRTGRNAIVWIQYKSRQKQKELF